jgi:hypothetical protein
MRICNKFPGDADALGRSTLQDLLLVSLKFLPRLNETSHMKPIAQGECLLPLPPQLS